METKVEIKEMPSKEALEQFIAQIVLGETSKVIFDTETGTFNEI